MNRPPPTAGDNDVVFVAEISKSAWGISQSVQALFTLSRVPPTIMEKGTCPTILLAIIEAVSEPSSLEYSKVVA